MGEEEREVVKIEEEKLFHVGFIQKAQYTTWLGNIVLVPKSNNKWCMCTNYTNLNKVYPKDAYPLPSIGRRVDGVAGHCILSFLNVYSRNNRIPMDPKDKLKMTFITYNTNFYYEVMPFGLKNVEATYERLMIRYSHD